MPRYKQECVDIVLVTWGRQELTKLTIESIIDNTKHKNYRLIVVDNNSPMEMVNMLMQYHTEGYIHELVLNNENRGLEPARNQGLALVKNKYMVCLDNDLLCPPMKNGMDWTERMVHLMEDHMEYGAIAMRTQIMIGTGNIYDRKETLDIVRFPHPGGSYRIMRTFLVKQAGGWRDDVYSRGTEERHICGKIHELGYKTGFAVKIKSLHLFGNTATDNWGYPKHWEPEDTGHSDVWHPIFASGDDENQIKHFLETGEYE